jgi:hypothetical protein
VAEEGVIGRSFKQAFRVAAAALCAVIAPPVLAIDDCIAALGVQQAWIAEGDGVRVAFVAKPMPVPLNQHFALELAPCDDARTASALQVDADMPAHRHGMNYRAMVAPLRDGVYRAQGLMFHMPGRWRVIVDVVVDGRARRATREIDVQ